MLYRYPSHKWDGNEGGVLKKQVRLPTFIAVGFQPTEGDTTLPKSYFFLLNSKTVFSYKYLAATYRYPSSYA
jgi:hypothetical protein